ncbi:ABC transporter permease [Paenibacillus ferrarius]|uniref:ABC transporter permease n=1 Tax=Paenibacillus ferrarius TaxID=1469647 RepID=UPI003D2A3EA2
MSVLILLWRNVWHRKTLSLLTIFSVAVTAAVIVLLLLYQQSVEVGAEKGYGPFEVTIGAKGSATQLALNTYYHLGAPTGNIPYSLLEEVRANQQVEAAYAMTTGDNYNGYPIVGMEPGYFATRYGTETAMASGKLYAKLGDTVVGAHVAKALGLHIGDTFTGAHGLVQGAEAVDDNDEDGEEEAHHHSFAYTVVGILPPLLTADDRAIFTTLDYAWAVHALDPDKPKEVTTILVKPRSLLGAQAVKTTYGGVSNVQAIYTSKAVADVVNVLDKGSQAVSGVTVICVVLAACSILLSLMAAVQERKKDVALLRLIGKSRQFIWFSLLGEGLLLTLVGLLLGLALGHFGSYVSREAIFDSMGLQIQSWQFLPGEWWLIGGTLLVAVAATLGPSWQAYRVEPLQLFRS